MRTVMTWFCMLSCCVSTFMACFFIPPCRAAAPPAEDTVALHNRFGNTLRGVYCHARGHEPWLLAEAIEDGGSAAIEREKLRVCRRLIVESEASDGAKNAVFQFFTPFTLEDVKELTVSMRKFSNTADDAFPSLMVITDRGRSSAAAGVTFSILNSHIEAGMTRQRWDEFMNPLGKEFPGNMSCAVELAFASWDMLPPGPVFSKTAQGEVVTELTLTSFLIAKLLPEILREFDHSDVAPWRLTLGGQKTVVFSNDALAEAPGAELVQSDAGASFSERRKLLSERLAELISAPPGPDAPDTVIVMKSNGMRYELRLDFSARKFILHIKGV